ncbi:MAG: hypothetical protein B7Z23_12325 [Pseudomonadales bacterium 32-61-5]|nr:MAG: hypothetical protein B7Z23_12325 [Pseudomonadales bacterium 32-61-5]
MAQKLIKGTAIEMDGIEYIVPPLTLGAIQELQPEVEKLADPTVGGSERFAGMAKIVHRAMLRNYPDLTIERVKNELLDMGNVFEVTNAVMGASGFMPKTMGEALAVSAPIGTASTPT